ncbi:Os01g0237200, partial [Oryza sativa Japonica Group]
KNLRSSIPIELEKINVDLDGRIKDCKNLTYRQDHRILAKEIEQYRIQMLQTRQVFHLNFYR